MLFRSDDSFIFVDNGHDAKEIREALKTLPKAHYVVFMLYRSQISGNSRKDRSVTEYSLNSFSFTLIISIVSPFQINISVKYNIDIGC